MYLDSEGQSSRPARRARATRLYESSELKFDFIEAGKTLMEVSAFLTDDKTHEKIVKLHVSTVPMSVLWVGAAVAGSATLVVSAAAFAIGSVFALIDLIEGKADSLSPKLETYLLGIKQDLKLIDDRLTSDARAFGAKDFRKTAATFGTNHQDTLIQNRRAPLGSPSMPNCTTIWRLWTMLLEPWLTQDWSPLYRFDDYKQLFIVAQPAALHVRNKDETDSPYEQRDVGRRFDYRLGLPILAYVASVYPVLLAAAVPWFRSSGSYADQLACSQTASTPLLCACIGVLRPLNPYAGVDGLWRGLVAD